jgi:hypothetical protein
MSGAVKKQCRTAADRSRGGHSEKRKGTYYHTLRDLRNGNLIKNVTRSSARRLWHYAITKVESDPFKEKDIKWHGDMALLNKRSKTG